MTTRFSDHLLEGDHAGRPAATTVPEGTLYSCSDHALVYQSDGAAWSTWATLGTAATDATITTSDITTNNASTSKHGWLKKLSNVATEYMDGTGAWSTPAGGGGGSFVGCKAYSAAVQTIPDNTTTAVEFELEEFDTHAFHDLVTNNTRFTIPSGKAGKYSLQGSATIPSNASNVLAQHYWQLGGSTTIRGSTTTWYPSTIGDFIQFLSTAVVDLAVGDYVEFMIWQDSGGSRNIGDATSRDIQSVGTIVYLGA